MAHRYPVPARFRSLIPELVQKKTPKSRLSSLERKEGLANTFPGSIGLSGTLDTPSPSFTGEIPVSPKTQPSHSPTSLPFYIPRPTMYVLFYILFSLLCSDSHTKE